MSNVMLFFSNFLDTCEDRLLLSFSQKDGEEMTITTTFYNGDEIKYQPLVVRGTIDDLAKESGYWAEIKKFKDEIIPRFSSLADLEKEIEETEKKYNEKLKKANKIPDVKKGRCSGAFDQEIVNRLLVAPINDDAYPKILESANLQTILEVLPLISDTQDKKRFNKVSAELKKVTGAGAEEQGIMYEKAVENKQPALF